jgi:hypothetical protein
MEESTMEQNELERQVRRLHSHAPLLGTRRRRKACARLAQAVDADAVPHLAEALGDPDPQVRETADRALRTLRDSAAVDALCAVWVENREESLSHIIEECRYVATQPVEVRALSALRADKGKSVVENVPILEVFVRATQDADGAIAQRADATLRSLGNPKARTGLCRLAMREPAGGAAKICVETGYRPPDPEECCLFLFVTRQFDAYFEEDYEFQNLRLAYDRANAAVQAHVMDVMRSGDRRCLGFFGARKPLSECSEQEIRLALDSGLRHKDWPRLFEAFLQLPLKYGFPLLEPFRASGWQPDREDLRSLYHQALKDSEGQPLPEVGKSDATSPLFDQCLARPAAGSVEQLRTATPMEGVSIVAGLARQGAADATVAEAVRTSPHWLVRLAGYATGICRIPDVTQESVSDANYWVEALAGFSPLLEFWPGRATPTDLDALQSAPREAFAGRFGAVRCVLQGIVAYRTTTGEFEEIEIEAGEFAGEFEEAD